MRERVHAENRRRMESRNRPTRIWPIDVWHMCRGNSIKKGESFQQKRLKKLDIHTRKRKRITFNLYFISYMTINSGWIINLNVKCTTIMCLEENIGENLWALGLGRVLRHDARSIVRVRNNLKSLLCKKDTVKRMKRWAADWEKILAYHTSVKGLAFGLYKEL